jgi:hypothetical protein
MLTELDIHAKPYFINLIENVTLVAHGKEQRTK